MALLEVRKHLVRTASPATATRPASIRTVRTYTITSSKPVRSLRARCLRGVRLIACLAVIAGAVWYWHRISSSPAYAILEAGFSAPTIRGAALPPALPKKGVRPQAHRGK